MSGKGSISRMSDECLMTLETVFPFYIVYQAVMRKFTLAGKSALLIALQASALLAPIEVPLLRSWLHRADIDCKYTGTAATLMEEG